MRSFNPPAAEHLLFVVEDDSLSWGDCSHWSLKHYLHTFRITTELVNNCWCCSMPVADLRFD